MSILPVCAALVFWGWQMSFLPIAVAMALGLAASRRVKARLDVSGAVFERLSDLCTLFFAGVVVFAYATKPGTAAIMTVIGWLPFTLFPLVAAQVFSVQGQVDLGAFFWTLRRRAREGKPPVAVDFAPVYLAVCALAASTANVREPGFYLGLCALAAWALWRRDRRLARAALLLLAAVLGWFGHVGLHALQDIVEMRGAELVFGKLQVRVNPFQGDTAIGRIGALKRSDRIVLRMRTRSGENAPRLLRDSGYDVYKDGKWFAREAAFKPSASDAEAGWRWAQGPSSAPVVFIAAGFRDGQAMLALPEGAFALEDLPAEAVSRNRFGAVKAEGGPGFAEFAVRHDPALDLDGGPKESDLLVPDSEKALFSGLAAELRLRGRPAAEVLIRVSAFFQDGFSYSVYQDAKKVGARPLEDFLLRHRSGHCEYYATSAALLLRAAGLPSRYATGYSVQEYGDFEKAFLVRQKHAHAWTRAYVDGSWRDFDTTPPSWVAEETGSSWSRPVRDLLSWASYRFSRWRWRRSEGGGPGKTVYLILLPLAAFLAWRLRVKVALAKAEQAAPRVPTRGMDSEFFQAERALSKRGLGRKSWEPGSLWLTRVGAEDLRPLLSLHNRHRFDPEGLSADERERLRAGVREWLSRR